MIFFYLSSHSALNVLATVRGEKWHREIVGEVSKIQNCSGMSYCCGRA
jgi:hypothetical protein